MPPPAPHPTTTPLALRKLALAISLAAVSGSFAGTAFAGNIESQQIPSSTAKPDQAKAQVEQITVTARRRVENAQDVPSPISVLSGNELEKQKIYQVQDLQQVLPSVNAAFIHARQSSVAVRGIGNNPANEGLEGSVGLYLDNVFLGRPGMAVFDVLDVEQIELLRGPQGTLFGKNTTAGVLNISTRKPTFEPERSVEASLGNRGYQQYKLSASGGISDTLAARISVSHTHDDGWLTNLYNGEKLDEINRDSVRGQLLFQPSKDLSFRLIAEHHEEDSSTGTTVPYGFGPVAAGKRTLLQQAAAAGSAAIPTDPYRYEVNIDGKQQAKVHQSGLSLEANAALGDYRLTSITAWRSWAFRPKNDIDLSTASGIADLGYDVDDAQFSQEFRLASPSGRKNEYVVGAYYFYQDTTNTNFTITGPKGDVFLNPGSLPAGTFSNVTSFSHGSAITNSFALFGQNTLHLTSKLDLTAGLRITSEKKDANVYRDAPIGGNVYTKLPAVSGAWNSGELSTDKLSPSGLLGLSYRFTPTLLGYLSAGHGEKSGGFNINGVASGPTLGANSLRVDPEKADSAELGFKSTLFDRRLQFNANVYFSRITGYQTNTYLINPLTNLPVSALTNAGSVQSRGVEFELKAAPLRGLTVNANGSYNDAHYQSFTRAPCSAEQSAQGKTVCDLSGQVLNGAPKWTFKLGGQYELGQIGKLRPYAAANYGWRSGSYGDLSNSRYSWIPSYGLLNLATGWRVKQGENQWELSLWAKNALDKHYYLATSTASFGNAYWGSAGQPRTVGATLRYDF